MLAVIQRVRHARVVVDAQEVGVWWSSNFGHINRRLSCRFTLKRVG